MNQQFTEKETYENIPNLSNNTRKANQNETPPYTHRIANIWKSNNFKC